MKKKMMRNTVTSVISQLVSVIYGFVLPRLILEQFGSDVNGLTQSIKQFLTVISFLDMGVGQVIRSALYRPLAENNREQLNSIMASGRKFYRGLARGLVAYVVVLTCVYPLLAEQNYGWLFTATLIVSMAVSSFAQFYFGIINDQLLHADQRGYILYSAQIIANVANVVICVVLIQMGGSIQLVKLAASAVFLLKAVAIELYIRRHYQLDRKAHYQGEPIRQKWNGVAQHISAVVLDSTDTIVLTMFSTLSNVSVYSVYYMVISSIQSFYQAATAGIQSAAGALWAKGDCQAQEKMFVGVEMALHSVTVFLFCCTGILLVPFIRVYTNGLTDAQYIQPLFAAILALAYGIRCLRTPYNIWILAAGHYKQTQICHITAAVLNLVTSVIAVSQWGLVGVAVGTLVAMVYQTGWMAWYNTSALLHRPLGSIVKRFAVDFLTAAVICLLAGRVQLAQVSYFGWFVMAVQVALIAMGVTVVSALVFYREQMLSMARGVFAKFGK